MPDDQNTTQNPNSEENSIPPSPQEPTEPALENKADLGEPHPSVPVEELGADGGNLKGVGYDNIPPPGDSIPLEPEKTKKNQAKNELTPEPIPTPVESSGEARSEPTEAPEPVTPQIPVNEALPESEPSVSEAKEEPKPIQTPEPELKPQPTETKPPVATSASFALALLVKARNAIQFRKKRKLDRIMTLFLQQSKITNDEVEKFLHVSDATASRYLSQLEKEGRIKQHGKTGAGVSYSRI